jgi:leucine dehydrogenase
VIDQRLTTWDGERLLMQHDRATGAWILIAIHSTVLGPAAGGTRMKPYPDLDAALEDALRLSEGMTYKFATPGLPFGGAKAVIMVPADLDAAQRPDLLRRYGSAVGELGGRFLTGPDLGTTPRDMDLIAETAGQHVFCRTAEAGGAGDPGPYTALGVFTAIETICERIPISLEGARIVVQGAGDVGGPLIERLLNAGADVVFSEVSDAVIGRYRDELGVDFVSPDEAIGTQCDVFVPCALGGVLNADTVPRLRCRAIAGSANNQLADPADAERLRRRGILYAPDFVANVGGAMAMPGIEALGWTREQAAKEVKEYVGRTLREVIETAAAEQITTDAAARRMAEARLAEAS